MPPKSIKYTKVGVIVHGKSELLFAQYICTNLHLKKAIISENGGKGSIQINGLLKGYLNKSPFNNLKKFAQEYDVEYDKKTKQLNNFKLFIIMDTDDCTEDVAETFISGKMFEGHVLAPYIVPIYNKSNIEDVLVKAKIMSKKIHDNEKGSYYTKIFPINKDRLSMDTLAQINEFDGKIRGLQETNMSEFINYCKGLIEKS